MALWAVMQTSRRAGASQRTKQEAQALTARIAELEVRMQLLEARMRRVVKESQQVAESVAHRRGRRKGAKQERPRPRCPGCLLELPRGRRGEECVWCGFVFSAVEAKAAKR